MCRSTHLQKVVVKATQLNGREDNTRAALKQLQIQRELLMIHMLLQYKG